MCVGIGVYVYRCIGVCIYVYLCDQGPMNIMGNCL